MQRRAFLLAGAAGLAGLVGCLETNGIGGETASPDPTETDTPTDEPFSWEEASETPNPDLPISVENHHDETHTVSIAVVQDETTVYEETHELDPDASDMVYNLEEADPDGIESFTVSATLGEQTESVGVETNDCYGGVYVWIEEDGDLAMTYSIC